MEQRDPGISIRGEEILEPDLPICDPHHHLWDLPGQRYLLDELLADIDTGHAIDSTVLVEAGAFYRADAPPHLRAAGETEFGRGVAAMAASGRYGTTRVAAGMVASADLSIGAAVEETLAVHREAGGRRLRGIRQSAAWDADPHIRGGRLHAPEHLYLQDEFQFGFSKLQQFGLTFDAFVNHPQLSDVVALARTFPQQVIVVDHIGGLLGVGPYAGRHDEIFVDWRRSMLDLATCGNVIVKLGGLGLTRCGFGFHRFAEPPGSHQLADRWRPWIETCIAAFGVRRCMFESNFPVDKRSTSYPVLWNAFKRITAGCSDGEKNWLFRSTARHTYGLDDADTVSGIQVIR